MIERNRHIPWFIARSAVFALTFASASLAAPVTGPWLVAQGGGPVTSANTASPVVGDGTPNSADTDAIYSSMPTASISSIGDKVTLSGTANMIGSIASSQQFRFGLYDANGSSDTSNWLGYFATQGNGTSAAIAYERGTSIGLYFSSTGVTTSTTGTAPETGMSFNSGTYNFLISLERVASGLQINSSIKRASDSQDFGTVSFLDTTPQTYDFQRVGFLIGGGLDADQVQFSNIDVTFSTGSGPGGLLPLPPGAIRLMGVDFNRDDALGSPSQSHFRVISGSAAGAGNPASYQKTIGGRAITVSQPDGIPLEFRGANSDSSRAIPGGDTSRAFLVSDFIATRAGRIRIEIGSLPAGDYLFRSFHLDPFTGTTFSFAQGSTTTTRNTIEARIAGTLMDSVQPTCLGAPGLNSTFINDSQIPALDFTFSHDGSPTLTIDLEATLTNGADRHLLLNGFELFALPAP